MAYDKNFPANDGFLAEFPEKQRAQIEALINDAIVNAKTVQNLDVGNDNGNIPVANGTECKNLNAGLLSGKMASDMAPKIHGHDTATPSSDGFLSNVDKTKLDTIAERAQVNQNVFANIKVGDLTLQPDAPDDTLELVAGTNIELVLDTTNDKITIRVVGIVENSKAVGGASLSQLVRNDVSSVIKGDSVLDFGPNSQWGGKLRIGGNGHTDDNYATIATSNGNLHMDSKLGNAIYLNYYSGGDIVFGKGGTKSYIDANGVFQGTANNANYVAGLAVSGGRNNVGNQVVRTDGNGYLQAGYINSSNGDEGNNSNPVRVWGTNGSDSYLRTYLISALSVHQSSYTENVGNDNTYMRFHWAGQGGQPTWLWGGNDASNMYVWNPSNFSVNYANNAGAVNGYSADALKNRTSGRNTPVLTPLIDWSRATEVGTNSGAGLTGQGSGDIYLKQSYKNFDKILVHGLSDGADWSWSQLWEKWELDCIFGNTYRFTLARSGDAYWMLWSSVNLGTSAHPLSTETCWKLQEQNCRIKEIYGLTY